MSISTVLLGAAVFVLGVIVGKLPDVGGNGDSLVTLLAGPSALAWVIVVTWLSQRSADNEAP